MNEGALQGVKVLRHFASLCMLHLDMQSISFCRSQSKTSASHCPSLRTCGGCDAGQGNKHGWGRMICWDPRFSDFSVPLTWRSCWNADSDSVSWKGDFWISTYLVGSKALDPEILSSATHKNHMGSFQNHWCPMPHPRTIKLESGVGLSILRF